LNKNTEKKWFWGGTRTQASAFRGSFFGWGVSIRSSWRGASAKTTQKNAIEATKNPPSFPSLFLFLLFCSTAMAKKPSSAPLT
jgi:hypothetical protein